MPPDRDEHGRAPRNHLGDRPEFDEWMKDVESALAARDVRSSDRKASSDARPRKRWFGRVRSILVQRAPGGL